MDGSNKKQEDWEFVPLESKEPSWEFVPLEDKGVLSRAKQAVTDFFTPQPSKEASPRQLTPEEEMMSSFGAAPAPRKAAPPPLPGEPQAEMTEWQPSLWEEFLGLLPGDRAKAANEVLARRIAREQKIPVDEAYRRMREAVGVRGVAGTRPGGRPMFNPEGRATIQAITEAAPFVAEGLLDIPKGTAEALLRTYRAGDIESALDKGFVDQSIAYLGDDAKDIFIPNIPKKLGISPDDPNYQSFMGLGKSLGYSLTTMVASIVGATAGSTVGPLGAIAGGMGAAGAVAYRGSKDDFLDRLRTKLNKESKKTFGRPMSDAEWNAARKKFDSAATEYGAWEAVPEAVSNAIFLKAFAAPARTASGARLAGYLEKATSVAAENLTETVTGLGQNAAELKAGLTNNELTVADAFKQQFIQTMMTMGFMAGTLKAKQLATQFYNDQVLPRVSPGSALAKAIEADLNNYVGYTPAAFRSRSATEARAAEEAARRAAGTQAPEPPEAPVAGEPPIAPSGAPGGERIEPTLGAEPELPPSARVEPTFVAPPVQVGASPEEVQAALAQAAPGVVGLEETVPEEAAELPADLTPEEQNLVIAYMQQGFTQEEAVARTLKKRKGAELPDAVRQWDRANRSGRQTEWQVGAAESNPAFESLGSAGYNTPAHGMAKVGTLGEAYNNLVSLLSGNIDPNRPLYTAGLTAPAGVGAGTGTAGGYAYRDGPFIITFRQGLTGQPTSADITGVLVNPANAELVPVLQKQFPNLVVRSYNEVADVVNASRTSAPEGQLAPTEAQVPPAIKPAAETPSAPSLETAVGYIEPVPVPINELSLSKDVPQFKMGADAKGVVEPLVGKFTNIDVAPIQVWRRLDGSLEVISGRHRLDLARRSGEKTIPAQVHDEAQGFTPTMAAVLDAELNIRDGQGKVKDYVNYFKAAGITPEDAESKGFLARPKGKRAYTIATGGSDELVTALRNDQVGDEAAYYIALNAPNDPRLQAVGIQGVMDGKSANLAVNTMLAMKALGVENNTTTDMFGFDDSAVKEAQAMAQVANRKQKEIQTRLSAISGAAKNPEVAKAEGIDIRDPDAVNKRIGELRQLKAAWDNWPTNPDLVREVRQARGVQAPSLTLRGETEEEIRAREEAAAAEEKRRRAEEEAAKRAEQEAFDRKRAAETADLFQLGQTAAQQMSGMGDLFAPPVEEKPAEKPAFQVGERVVYNRPESKIFPDEFPAAQIGATVDFVYNNNRVAIVRDDNGQTEVVPANDLAKPSAEKPAALDLMKDGIEGREIPFTEVPNGREEFQYALGRTEEGGKEAIYRRRANERGTYGGWRWEADKPVAKAEAQKPAAKKEVKANEYFVENLGETLAFPDIIEWYRRAYRNMEQARDAYRKGEIDDEQFLEQKNEFEEIKAEVEQIEAKEYGKPKAAKSAEGRGVDQEFVQKAQNHWMSVVHPALVEYGIAYRQFGEQRMENARIKEPGIGPDEWLTQLWHQQSKFEKGRKVQDTGIQYLSQKDLWPTTDGSGERLRKAMLNAVKALKNAPSTNGEWIKRSINGESDIFGEGAKPAEVKEPPEIRQARREMAQGVKLTPAVLKRRRALIEWEKSQEPARAREPEFTADNIVNGEQPAADLPATNRLVFMPCSAKKGGKAGPAMDLYQGVFFQTFRSNVPSDAMPNVVILSAEHGFIGPDTQIEPYDRLLDKARADEMLGDMPKVITDIKKAMAGIPADQIKDVLLVGGKEYQAVMRAALAQMKEDGLIPEDASVNATSGGIGEQRQQLGQYLRALPAVKKARVLDMTARREAQLEREEEAEEEAIAEESRVEAIKRLKKEYKPLAHKIWEAAFEAKRVLKQSQFPNSLEYQDLQRQIEELEDVIASYNELNMQTPLGASVFNVLPRAMELVKSEGKLERLEEVAKLVAEKPPKGIGKFKAKKKEEPGLFNIEVPGKRDQATWSPERVDMLVNEYEYFQGGRENDTKAYAAFINPAEFVRATTGPGELRQELLRAEDGLDMKRLREERQTPFLLVEFVPGEKAMWRIEGHEGRHRMGALAAAGVKRAPVLIRMVGEAKAWAPVKEQWLSGQKFGPTSREKGDAVQITDLTPISFARRDELQKKFAGEGIAFSIEQPEAKPTKRMSDEDIRDEQIREYSALRQSLAAVPRRIAAGKSALRYGPAEGMTELERVYLKALVDRAQDLKAAIKMSAPRLDSPEQFLARALKEYDAGNISKEVLDVIQAAYKQQPGLLNGLKLSIKQAPEGAGRVAGAFLNMSRIVRLYKGSSGVDDPKTIRHELTHSLEQMMTPEQRGVVIDKWQDDLAKAILKHKDAAHQKYFDALLKFLDKPTMETYKAALAAMPSYDMYQFINPSEYWAVNAESLMASQLGGHWQRFKAAIKRMFEALKDLFGFDNKYVVQRVFKDIMTGSKERVTTEMLADRAGISVSNAQNIEEDKKLIAKYNRGNTPMLDKKPLKTFMLDQWKNSKDLLKDFINNPLVAAADAGSSAFDAAIKARMSTVWFGAGLESRDFAQYQGQLRTSEGLAIASVALDNAIHSGNIGIQVIFQGGLEYDQRTGRFVAVDRELGMRGVYEAEQKLKKKLGAQLGTNIIQGYLEAKRSISIMNELYDRQEAFEEAKESLSYIVEQGGSEDDINAARDLVAEAKNDLDAVKKAVSSVTMTEEEMYEFAALDKRHPELRDIMRNWNAINQNLLRVWKAVGLLSEKRYNTLSAIKDYVPWQRIMNDGDDPVTPLQSTTRNLTNIGREKLFKRGKPTDVLDFKGADGKKILNADGQMIGASFAVPPSTVVRVEIDGQKVPAELLSVTPEGRVLIEGPIDDNSLVVFKVTRPIQNIVENMTQNVMRMTMNAIRHYAAQRIVYEYATRAPDGRIMTFPSVDTKKGRFNFIIDGQKKIVEISDPLVVASIYGMDKLDLEMWKPLALISNFVRRSITLSGAFQIEQVIKDAPTAAIVTGVRNPVKLIGGTIKGFITALIQPATKAIGIDIEPTINILKAAGIGGFHSPARTPQAEIKRRMGIMNRNVYDAMIKLLDHIGDSSDMAQRVATYKRVLAETGDESQALMQAANVINFLHRGSSGAAQALFKTVPFMSAYANSTDVLANALIGGNLKGMRRRKAVARLAMTTGLLASLTIIYAMINGGDPEYEELDDETKMKNIIVPGTKVKIPINTSAAYIWKALPEMIYNKIINEGTKNEIDRARLKKALSIAAKDMLLGPEPIPAGIRPVMEVAMDRSFFTERSITPRRLQNVEAFEQWDASTSELGKKLSALTEFGEDGKRVLNPFEADHLVRGIFGSVGFTAQYITNQIAVQAGERPELTGRETPLFGRFIMPEVGRRNEDLFYDLKERVDEKYNTWQTIINRGDDAAADKYEDKHEKLLDLYHDLNKANEELGEINSEIRELGTSKDLNMTPEARRKGINELQREKMEVLEDVIEMRKEGGL